MKKKATSKLTKQEREILDTSAINYVLAQSDGFQLGYATAIRDFNEYIIDYWKGSDDEPQQSVLDALTDLGIELEKRKDIAKKNIEKAKNEGYENYYHWRSKTSDGFSFTVNIFTKNDEGGEKEK